MYFSIYSGWKCGVSIEKTFIVQKSRHDESRSIVLSLSYQIIRFDSSALWTRRTVSPFHQQLILYTIFIFHRHFMGLGLLSYENIGERHLNPDHKSFLSETIFSSFTTTTSKEGSVFATEVVCGNAPSFFHEGHFHPRRVSANNNKQHIFQLILSTSSKLSHLALFSVRVPPHLYGEKHKHDIRKINAHANFRTSATAKPAFFVLSKH